MLLEGLAEQYGEVAPFEDGYIITNKGMLDFHSLLATLADCKEAAYGAALFHATLAAGLVEWVLRAAAQSNINHVALGGGCFLNNLLSQALTEGLSVRSLHVLTAHQLPPNDGGISLGQASVALQSINQGV